MFVKVKEILYYCFSNPQYIIACDEQNCPSKKKSSLDTTDIIGILLGSVLFIILLFIIMVPALRRKVL